MAAGSSDVVRLERGPLSGGGRKGASASLFRIKLGGYPRSTDGVFIEYIDDAELGCADDRSQLKVNDRVVEINGTQVTTFETLDEVKRFVREQPLLELRIEKAKGEPQRKHWTERAVRRAGAVPMLASHLPGSWYDTLELRFSDLRLYPAHDSDALPMRASGAHDPSSEAYSAWVQQFWDADRSAEADDEAINPRRPLWVRVRSMRAGDTFNLPKEQYAPQTIALPVSKLVQLRCMPTADEVRIELCQRSADWRRSAGVLASAEFKVRRASPGHHPRDFALELEPLQRKAGVSQPPLGCVYFSARCLTTSIAGAATRIQSLARGMRLRRGRRFLIKLTTARIRLFHERKAATRKADEDARTRTATRFQAACRGHQARQGCRSVGVRARVIRVSAYELMMLRLPLAAVEDAWWDPIPVLGPWLRSARQVQLCLRTSAATSTPDAHGQARVAPLHCALEARWPLQRKRKRPRGTTRSMYAPPIASLATTESPASLREEESAPAQLRPHWLLSRTMNRRASSQPAVAVAVPPATEARAQESDEASAEVSAEVSAEAASEVAAEVAAEVSAEAAAAAGRHVGAPAPAPAELAEASASRLPAARREASAPVQPRTPRGASARQVTLRRLLSAPGRQIRKHAPVSLASPSITRGSSAMANTEVLSGALASAIPIKSLAAARPFDLSIVRAWRVARCTPVVEIDLYVARSLVPAGIPTAPLIMDLTDRVRLIDGPQAGGGQLDSMRMSPPPFSPSADARTSHVSHAQVWMSPKRRSRAPRHRASFSEPSYADARWAAPAQSLMGALNRRRWTEEELDDMCAVRVRVVSIAALRVWIRMLDVVGTRAGGDAPPADTCIRRSAAEAKTPSVQYR